MTSITSLSSPQVQSPRDLLQNELLSEISSGIVGSSDGTALSSALDDIDAALKSDASSSSGPPSPGDMKSKIDDLISAEVKNGKLTSDQADELKNIFAKAMPHGGRGGPGGPGDPGGPDGSADAAGDQTSDSQGTSSDSSASTLLQDFLKLLQDAQNTTGYGASGDNQKSLSALLVSFQT